MTPCKQFVAGRTSFAALIVAVVALLAGSSVPVAIANEVVLPPPLGESAVTVFVEATGQPIGGVMLDYWRANGAEHIYGNPISAPFVAPDGRFSQAFEAGIFQYRHEFLFTTDPIVRLMPIGPTALRERLGVVRRDGRRGFGGGDRRTTPWTDQAPESRRVERALAGGGAYTERTGHTISGDMYDWHLAHEGAFYLGDPLSEPVAERGATVQYFEGGLVIRRRSGAVSLAPLARELAPALGIDTRPTARNGLPLYREALFMTAPHPDPAAKPAPPGRKWIDVDITRQRLTAYQGDAVVLETPISTGLAPNETSLGRFHVRLKYPEQDMSGFQNDSGEVVGVGTEGPDGTISYVVDDVPNVLYFTMNAEALHGTYWHSNFGWPMSHGCVNLPLAVAAYLYGWAPLGTLIWVHE